MMNIPLSIREGLKNKGASQVELAAHLAKSKQMVSYWATGTKIPSLPVVSAMAAFFNVPVSEFIRWGETTSKVVKF